MSSDSTSTSDEQQVCFGTPTMAEMKRYLRKIKDNPLDRIDRSPETPSTTDESSFELEDSFLAIIEKKRKQLIESKALESDISEDVSTTASLFSGGGDADSRYQGNDSTFLEQDSINKITDESFEEMERLCTLDRSRLGVSNQFDEEDEAIRRILESSSKNKTVEMPPPHSTVPLRKVSNISRGDNSMGLADVTQLDDVEEPSCLWENSIVQGASGGPSKLLSPVKRVHMLRPSTIIEEATINETASNNNSTSKNTSLESYCTAQQHLDGSDNYSMVTGSEVYRTAEEGDESLKSSIVNSTTDSAAGFEATANKTSIELSYSRNVTLVVEHEDDDIIVLSSSDSESEDDDPEQESSLDESGKLDTGSIFETSEHLQENSLCQNSMDSMEEPGSPLLDAIPDHFNDTLEEMEFMMRQGMKIMQQKKAQQQQEQETNKLNVPTPSSGKKTLTTHQMTPVTPASPYRYLKAKQPTSSTCKQNLFQHSASKTHSAQKPTSALSTGSSNCGAFKKPVSRFPLPKSAKKFDHIVSPIGTYIKKTPTNTLQARIFCPNQNLIDVLHSRPENRESVMSSKENFTLPEVDPSTYSSSLPRKGVVSSRGAHVLDERAAVRIPGGEKMQKLLNNSPTMVIRHEGRLKYLRETKLTDDSVADDSMADLSLASGDVSVRVLKDVRRF